MSWKMTNILNERMKFVVMTQSEGVNVTELCREFGITRACGYKWIRRFNEKGLRGLQDHSRRPTHCKDETPSHVICEIVRLRQSRPTWGGRKIRRKIRQLFDSAPTARTIDRILVRCGLVIQRRKTIKKLVRPYELQTPSACNDIWTLDLKGWWKALDGNIIEPLTLRDSFSKFVLKIYAMKTKNVQSVKAVFIDVFSRYGLPLAILCDNGAPWAFRRGLCGLTRLSVWWMKLGITPIFIPPASPQCNGAHERLHLDMMKELESYPAATFQQEQDRLTDWRHDYNNERPHQAINDQFPAATYYASKRKYSINIENAQWQYPARFHLRRVLSNGKLNWKGKVHFFSKAFADQTIAFEVINAKKMNIWFHDYCLGHSSSDLSRPIIEYKLQPLSLDMRKKIA